MASDEVTVRHVLGLLDRLSSKTLNRAVLQFKDHAQRFHESLSELKSLKLPTGECIIKDFAHLPLNSGGHLSNAIAQPFSQSLQAKCTPLKSPLKAIVVREGIENYGSNQHALQSQVKCTPSEPPFNSTVVPEGTEDYGSKKYTLRSRKLSTTNPPQRITRSRAKQSVATGNAAASNNLPKTEFTVLRDDFVKVRNKRDGEPQQHQQDEPFPVSPKKCDAFAFHVTPSIPKQSPRLTTAVSHGTYIGHSVSPKKCDAFAFHVTPSIAKQSPCLTTAVSHGVSPKKCDAFAFHVTSSIPKQSPCLTTAVSHGMYIGHSVSPKKCDAFAFHVTPSIPKQSPCLTTAVSHGVSPKKCDAFASHVTSSIPKQSPRLTTAISHGTNVGHSISRKRKISICELSANGQHTSKRRTSPSYNSPLYEAFIIDEIVAHSPPGGIMSHLSPHDPLRTDYFERLNTPTTDYLEQKEGSHEINRLEQKDLASGMTLEELSQADGEVAGSRNLVEKSNSKGMECILRSVHEVKSAPPESAEVNTNRLIPRCEQTDESIETTHEVEHTGRFVSQGKQIKRTSSPGHSVAELQAEGSISSSHDEEVSLVNLAPPCLYEHVGKKLASCSKLEKTAPPESAEVNTNDLIPRCEQIDKSIETTHEVEHTGRFVSQGKQINGTSSPGHSVAELQAEGSVSSLHNEEVSLVNLAPPCLYEHVGEKSASCSKLENTNHGIQPDDNNIQPNACEEFGNLVVIAPSNQRISAPPSPVRLQLEKNGTVPLFQSDSPQKALQDISNTESQTNGTISPGHSVAELQAEGSVSSLHNEEVSLVNLAPPCLYEHVGEKLASCSKVENTNHGIQPEDNNIQPDACEELGNLVANAPSNQRISAPPSPDRLQLEKNGTVPLFQSDSPQKALQGISNTESEMDCSESPRSCHSKNEDDGNECKLQENESPNEWRVTPNGDDGFLKFTELLAQGTVNSSRRKRARSPEICTEESCKSLKRVKLSSTGKDELFKEKDLSHALYSQSPTFGRSNSSMFGFPHFSPLRRFQDTFGLTFGDSASKSFDTGDIQSLQRKIMGSRNLSKSYSKLPALRKDYSDTPHVRLVRAGLIDRTSIRSSKQKPECPLTTHLEEDGKENQSPETLNRDSNASIRSDCWQVPADTRKVLGYANHSLGLMESPHKRYNLAVGTGSFLSLVQQKQLPLPHPNGKREVRVKALEAAELARKQEMQREIERKRRKLEGLGAKGIDVESATDKLQGVTIKVKRVAELKVKIDQEKARKQEMEQRRKEEERKKKEAELADKKRKREDADKRDREEKRKRVEEVQRLRKEQEERQRAELNEKEHKRKLLEERERERKAQEEEAKRQRRLGKEKEAERRRKQGEHFKAARFAEKQAERKRKEAMLLQAHGNEDDEFIAQIPLDNKLSILSTESFAVSTSNDYEAQSKSVFGAKSQTSGEMWGIGVQSAGTSAFCQSNSEKVSENRPFLSTKQPLCGLGLKCEPFKSLSYTTPSNTRADVEAPAQLIPPESEFQSYEISPYRSSSDDEDDAKPKKLVPLWARKENLLQQLLWQQPVNPDRIFSSAKTCSLAEIFGTTGSRRCKDFTKRSASGDWLDDHATWKEELDYKNAMGYM